MALEASLAAQATQLADLGDRATDADLHRYGTDLERFQEGGGYEFHARVVAVLHGLGFDPEGAKTRSVDPYGAGRELHLFPVWTLNGCLQRGRIPNLSSG